MGPAAWWRLGETSGTVAVAQMGPVNGTYIHSPTLNQGGAVHDGNTAVAFSASTTQQVSVQDNDIFSLAIADDSFDRPQPPGGYGWGEADHGGLWGMQITNNVTAYFLNGGSLAQMHLTTPGTYQMALPSGMADGEIQVSCSWNAHPGTGFTDAAAIVARVQDINNFYRVLLKERADHSLELSIVSTVQGNATTLMALDVGTYTVGDWWVIRCQFSGNSLRARAWNRSQPQPTTWQIDTIDSSFATGTVALRAANSGSNTDTLVSFDDFWIQHLGLTVYAWLRIDRSVFDGSSGGEIGSGGTWYLHWLGKGGTGQAEWTYRLYSNTVDPNDDRHGRVSGYIFNLGGSLGSGDDWQPGRIRADTGQPSTDPRDNLDPPGTRLWHNYVALFPAGDKLDTQARVKLYRDTYWQSGNPIFGGPGPGSLYSNTTHPIVPGNGGDALHFATRDGNSYLTGALDEVAIFNRLLTETEIATLYNAAL